MSKSPLTDGQASKPSLQASPPASVHRAELHALVVETDPATLRTCEETLRRLGYTVKSVDSGVKAVVAARQEWPDLIFVAFQLRDVTGKEAIGWLRTNPALRSTPILVLTDDTQDEQTLGSIGPSAPLRKPVSPASVVRAIREIMSATNI